MASCTSIKMFSGLVEDFIKQYEASLADDTLSDVETADTKQVLDELYSLRTAVKEDDRDYIDSHGFVQQRQTARQELLEGAFVDTLGQSFSYSEGNSSKTKQGSLVSVELTRGGFKVNYMADGFPKSHSFSLTTDSRSHDGTSPKDFIHIPKIRDVIDGYTRSLDKQEQLELVLGSRDHKLKLEERYKDDDYKHGDIDQMKNMIKRLHLLGGSKASQEELDTYLDLMDRMSPEFFNELDLYIKETAEQSEGTVRAKRMDITISDKPKVIANQQSEASIYMEEVIHSMTMSAIASKSTASTRLNRQLSRILETARKKVTWRNFLPETSIDAATEERYAKALYNYIFNSPNAEYEFLAKALTVPEVANAFKHVEIKEGKEKKRLLERINDLISALVDLIRGDISLQQKGDNVQDALVNLAFRFGEINNHATRTLKDKGNFLTAVFDIVNGLDEQAAALLNSKKDKILGDAASRELGPVPDSLYGRVKWVGQFITLSLVNPSYTKAMGAVATAWGVKPGSTVREVIGGMFASDPAQRVAEFLTMQAGYIDKKRNNQIDLVRKNVLKDFSEPKKVTKEQEEALTDVLSDTDLASLFGKDSVTVEANLRNVTYDNSTLRKLLTDPEALARQIKDVKRTLKDLDRTHYNWHSNQAVGLGIYMATHRGTPEQNFNATNIARGIHSRHSKKPDPAVVRAIDELATLVAIKNTDIRQRTTVADLMKTEWRGVQHVADVIEGFHKNSDVTVFKKGSTNKIKGYSREVFDDTIVMEVAPLEDRAAMEAQGFIFRAELAPRAGDIRNKPMALYVTDTASRPDRLRGGVRLNQITSKGTTITSLAFKDGEGANSRLIRERAQRDINNIHRDALARAKRMEEGEYDFTDTVFGVAPVINNSGKVIDYRYMMDKATKKSLLKQDTRISEVMARSYGNVLDKDLSAQHNEKALELLKKDMVENWTAGTKGNDGLTDYTLIGPEVADPEMRKMYYMLPAAFQEYINNRQDKTLAVRSDLNHLFFGYSHLSIANFPGLQRITPPVLIKLIKFAEMMWMEMIKIVKTNILMKMPTILISNIFSNMLYAVMRGYDPITVLKMYPESYRNISNYNKDVKRRQELENSLREINVAGDRSILSEQKQTSLAIERSRIQGEINAIDRRMKKSPIHELVELGMDQNVEDVTNDVDHDTNRIVNFFDEKLKNAPDLVRDGLDIMFITKRTKFYKVANEFLETSDLVARDVQNQLEKRKEDRQAAGKATLPSWWLEMQDEGYNSKQRLHGDVLKQFREEAKQRRHYDLVEDFINYTKPSSRMEEYLNKVGILMFTKYVKRIQRIIMKNSSNAPIKATTGVMAFGLLGGYPSIHEQSFLVKDWYGDSLGPGNVFPIYSPAEHFMNFITPSIVKESTYSF